MTPTIADLARSVLDGSARNDDAKALARWVLERVESDRMLGGLRKAAPPGLGCAYHAAAGEDCWCFGGVLP